MDKLLEDLANVVEMIPDDWDWHKCQKCGEPGLGNPWPELTHFIRTHHAEIAEMVKDAARYRKFCEQADDALFPVTVLEDAFEMGSGVIDVHLDAAIDAQHKSAQEGE